VAAPGTVTASFFVRSADAHRARDALQQAGFDVELDEGFGPMPVWDTVAHASRAGGVREPGRRRLRAHVREAAVALERAGIDYRRAPGNVRVAQTPRVDATPRRGWLSRLRGR